MKNKFIMSLTLSLVLVSSAFAVNTDPVLSTGLDHINTDPILMTNGFETLDAQGKIVSVKSRAELSISKDGKFMVLKIDGKVAGVFQKSNMISDVLVSSY